MHRHSFYNTQTLPMRLEDMIEDAAGIGACFKSPISQQKGVLMFLGLLLLAYFYPTERTHKHHIATGVPGHLITASSFRHVADSHRHPSRIPMDSLLTWTQLLPPLLLRQHLRHQKHGCITGGCMHVKMFDSSMVA